MSRIGVKPDRELLDTAVKRIVEIARPLRIILFGSAAEGRMGPDSDLDIVVVVQEAFIAGARLRLFTRASRGSESRRRSSLLPRAMCGNIQTIPLL